MSVTPRYLLDTNVVSETRKLQMNEAVRIFLGARDAASLFLSVLTVGELRKGLEIKRQTDPRTAAALAAWVESLEVSFADRVLGIDTRVARLWGELSADRPRPVIDTLLAATAIIHQMTLVTRNTKDLQGLPVALLDPWAPT